MAVEWFYELDGFRRGPAASGELKKLAESGAITPETLIWRDGLEERLKAGAVRGLFATTSPTTAQSQPAAPAPSTVTPVAPPAPPQPKPQYASPPAARRMNDANIIVTTGDIKRDAKILVDISKNPSLYIREIKHEENDNVLNLLKNLPFFNLKN